MDIKYISLNGKIVPLEDARVHILSPAVKYASSVFETIRGYWNSSQEQMFLFRLGDHLKRLRLSMKIMRFRHSYDDDFIAGCVLDLIRENGLRQDVHVRIIAYVDQYDGPLTATEPIAMAISVAPREEPATTGRGLDCAVSSWARIADNSMPPRIKCVANYHNSRLAWLQAKADGYDNAILLTQDGKVAEGPTACFFMVRNGVPVTPNVTSNILEGITRSTVIHMFNQDLGLECVERAIDRTELYDAEEAFFCSTGFEITPIATIDRIPVGDGGVGRLTEAAAAWYGAVVRGEIADHRDWRTPVYGPG